MLKREFIFTRGITKTKRRPFQCPVLPRSLTAMKVLDLAKNKLQLPPVAASYVIGIYVVVVGTGACAYLISNETVCLKFLSMAIVTIAVTYVEQVILMRVIGHRTLGYFLQCSPGEGECIVQALPQGLNGFSPSAHGMWDMPSASAQLMLMTVTFWTIFAREQRRNETEGERPSHVNLIVRTLSLWVVVGVVLAAILHQKLATVFQLASGLVLGWGSGRVSWAIANGWIS